MAAQYTDILLLATLLSAVPVAAQDEPLGRPAGWAVEESVSLITVASGSELYLEPDHTAMVLTILPEVQLPLVEARDTWVKVRYGDKVGWVDLEGGQGPGATRPVQFVVTERAEPLDIGDGWQEGKLGPYKLFSKVDDPALVAYLDLITSQHARVYAERYGLKVDGEFTPPEPPAASMRLGSTRRQEAVAEPAGSVLLFAGRAAFLDFQRSRDHDAVEARIEAYFHSPNTVLLYRGREPRNKLAATLIHELTHLVSWRVLRAGGEVETRVPPWLEEGMAEDLSLSRLDRKDLLVTTPLGPANLRFSRGLGIKLFKLGEEIGLGGTAPSLPKLLAMDKEAFFAGDAQLNYLMSAIWIRFLLSDADSRLATGFRGFLASLAAGGSPDAEQLRSRLGRGWDQLSQELRGWLLVEQARVGL